jgi:molybdate transport system substrate-binding protein
MVERHQERWHQTRLNSATEPMTTLHLLSGGAAQGLVRQLQASFEASHNLTLDTTFGAVGAMKQRLMEAAACDVLILTQALIDSLVQSGQVHAGSDRQLGIVKTGVAVKAGTPVPDVASADSLRQALRNAMEKRRVGV